VSCFGLFRMLVSKLVASVGIHGIYDASLEVAYNVKSKGFMIETSRFDDSPITSNAEKRYSHDQALRIAFCCDSRAVHHLFFVWSMLRYALLGRGTAGCSASFRFCPHSPYPCLRGKAPSCCHALEARVLVKQERPSRSHSAVPALGLRTHAMNPPKMRHPCSLVVGVKKRI